MSAIQYLSAFRTFGADVLALALGVTLVTSLFKKTVFKNRSKKLGELNGFIEEMISGQKTLKAYDQEENTIHKFDDKNKEAVDAYYKAEYYGSVTGPTVNFINNLSLSLISVFGALLYLVGQMSVGNISSFVLYSRKFSGPINEAANIISEFQSALAAAERVFQCWRQHYGPISLGCGGAAEAGGRWRRAGSGWGSTLGGGATAAGGSGHECGRQRKCG